MARAENSRIDKGTEGRGRGERVRAHIAFSFLAIEVRNRRRRAQPPMGVAKEESDAERGVIRQKKAIALVKLRDGLAIRASRVLALDYP
jgi:hypothetical protein